MKDSAVAAEAVNETAKNTAQQREIRKKKITSLLSFIGSILFRLRKLVLAAPVVYAAGKLAYYNREHLPEQVGINIQSTGEFAQMITRDMAVMAPLGLTAACLFLMLCSRKALYPWAISIFTLVLPILILFSNLYPA